MISYLLIIPNLYSLASSHLKSIQNDVAYLLLNTSLQQPLKLSMSELEHSIVLQQTYSSSCMLMSINNTLHLTAHKAKNKTIFLKPPLFSTTNQSLKYLHVFCILILLFSLVQTIIP